MSIELTDRQTEVLVFINEYRYANQMPPTRAEIARHFGWTSANGAEDHLRRLVVKGYIELLPGRSRGIRVLPEPLPMGRP